MKKIVLSMSLLPLLFITNVSAETPRQCIQAPTRTTPCSNLIYSSFRNNGANVSFCLCKTDKTNLQTLLNHSSDSPNQQKLTRQLVSQHRMTTSELTLLLNSVHD